MKPLEIRKRKITNSQESQGERTLLRILVLPLTTENEKFRKILKA